MIGKLVFRNLAVNKQKVLITIELEQEKRSNVIHKWSIGEWFMQPVSGIVAVDSLK